MFLDLSIDECVRPGERPISMMTPQRVERF